jgi:glutamate-1-semialdehyde aminotransferase
MAPSAYEVAFVSLAHDAEHIERASQAFERALEAVRKES